MIAGGYNGAFYTQNRVALGTFVGGYPQVQSTQIINNNNINVVNINQVPKNDFTTLKADPSTIVGQQGECCIILVVIIVNTRATEGLGLSCCWAKICNIMQVCLYTVVCCAHSTL